MSIMMTAKRTFDGLEGLKQPGDKVEVFSKSRAEALFKMGYATFKGDQGQDKNGEIPATAQDRTHAAKTHAELDDIVKEFKLDGVPTKDEGAKLEERKTAIKVALAV